MLRLHAIVEGKSQHPGTTRPHAAWQVFDYHVRITRHEADYITQQRCIGMASKVADASLTPDDTPAIAEADFRFEIAFDMFEPAADGEAFALLMLLNPAFISVLWRDELGLKLMMISFSLMVAGSLWMWRLIRAPY